MMIDNAPNTTSFIDIAMILHDFFCLCSVANSLRSKMANVSEKMAKMANRFLLHFYVTISW